MYKKTLAFFFTILFLALIILPSVIIAVDDSIDTSILYSMAEEEENVKSKNLVFPFSIQSNDALTSLKLKTHLFFNYQFKNYPKPHLNLISPPPEQIII